MPPRDEARSHLAKAEEFLTATQMCLQAELFSAATSAAVSAGVNAKDAVCLVLTGRTEKTRRHEDAVDELRRVGGEGAKLALTLGRLLAFKDKSQYWAVTVSRSDATKATRWAHAMVDAARVIVVTEP